MQSVVTQAHQASLVVIRRGQVVKVGEMLFTLLQVEEPAKPTGPREASLRLAFVLHLRAGLA